MLWDATFLPYIKNFQKENNCFLIYKLYKNRQWLFSRIELKKWKPSNVIQNMDQNADMLRNYISTIKQGWVMKVNRSQKTLHN